MFDDCYDSAEEQIYFERRYEESHYARFFEAALNSMLKKFNISQSRFAKAIDSMTKIYDYSSKDRFTEIEFTSENLCAYFQRFGPLSAGLTRYRILEAVRNCEEFKLRLQNLKGCENRVVSLGGGPGCDIIGFCSAVHGIIDCHKLDLTVVDNVEGWGMFIRLMDSMARGGFSKGFNSATAFRFQAMYNVMEVSTSFLWQDVLMDEDASESYSKTLQKADVVMMKSLLCVMSHSSAFAVAANVCLKMKEGAMLLFLDEVNFDFCQLGLVKIYSSVNESSRNPKESIYHFTENTNKSYGRGSAPFTNEKLTIYLKAFE